ncbi:MAG TPA: potassium transporter Kup [Nitrospira sp.]|nr:potassium transporter Kup [Nitrospira sp.]
MSKHLNNPATPISLAVAAMGVVYGDIGTSPLYALRECFHESHGLAATTDNILGIISLIVWSLVLVVTVKYLLFVMKADNDGQGGMLALMALSQRTHPVNLRKGLSLVTTLGLIGVAFLYSDGIITPAISVLSAVEGLTLATKFFDPYILPITLCLVALLFTIQRRGSGKIGSIFGPVMLIWFATMALLGLVSLIRTPEVLLAANPLYGLAFVIHHAGIGFLVLGGVFLVLTGAEALYADMGHFGRRPIQLGWFAVALPALLLQYFGQGALLMRDPAALANPFYHLAPDWMLYPLIALATLATVIASQAMLSGAFSLTLQAVQLGYLPPLRITHTSAQQHGQIYFGVLNWLMFVGSAGLILSFGSSSNLAAAYGLAVSGSMIITTLLMFRVTRSHWQWNLPGSAMTVGLFLVIDLAYVLANAQKIPHGGWFPLILGGAIFTVMSTWARGRAIVADHLREQFPPVLQFVGEVVPTVQCRTAGSAVFLSQHPDVTPPALLQNVRHNKVLHEQVYLLTVRTEPVPFIPSGGPLEIVPLQNNLFQVVARCGFMERPDIPRVLARLEEHGHPLPVNETTFFLSRITFIATPKPGMAIWREKLFVLMSRNTQRASSYFHLPAEQVVEIGLVLEI